MRVRDMASLTDEAPPLSATARGIGAGLLTVLIGVPAVAASLGGAILIRNQVPNQALASFASSGIDMALLANLATAGAAALFGIGIAAWIAMALVGRGRCTAFFATAGFGTALAAILTSLCAGSVFAGDGQTLAAFVATSWLMGLLGLYIVDRSVALGPDRELLD